MKNLTSLIIGITLSSLGIAMVANSGLGCFALTSANMAISNFTGMSLGTVGMLVELFMLLLATYKGEGIGLTAIINAIYGSYILDFFISFLPVHIGLVLGVFLLPIGWSLMGKAGLGDTGSNVLMNAILKETKCSISVVRGVQECLFMLIGFLGARNQVTLFTLILSVGLGYVLQVGYKMLGYDPTKIKHNYILRKGDKNE